jgi:hypothetical protein
MNQLDLSVVDDSTELSGDRVPVLVAPIMASPA